MSELEIKNYVSDNCGIIPNTTFKRFDIKFEIPEVVMVCSVVGIVESVKIHIEYIPDKNLIETASLRKLFAAGDFETTFEELVSGIYDAIYNKVKPVKLSVSVFRDDNKLINWKVTYKNM